MDDREIKNTEENSAYVMDEMYSEDIVGNRQSSVPPVPAAEEYKASVPAMRRAPREPPSQDMRQRIFFFALGVHAVLLPR